MSKQFVCSIDDFSIGPINRSLQALARRVLASGFDGMAHGHELSLVFDVRGKFFDERAFCLELITKNMTGVGPSLRDLVMAYIARGETSEGEYPESRFEPDIVTAPFGHMLLALVVLDKTSADVHFAYLKARDAGHECFTYQQILPAYIMKHGQNTVEDVRFCVHAMLDASNSNWSDWNESGTLMAAAMILAPSNFATIVRNILIDMGVEIGNGDDYDTYVQPLVEALQHGRWQIEVAQALQADWPQVVTALDEETRAEVELATSPSLCFAQAEPVLRPMIDALKAKTGSTEREILRSMIDSYPPLAEAAAVMLKEIDRRKR